MNDQGCDHGHGDGGGVEQGVGDEDEAGNLEATLAWILDGQAVGRAKGSAHGDEGQQQNRGPDRATRCAAACRAAEDR